MKFSKPFVFLLVAAFSFPFPNASADCSSEKIELVRFAEAEALIQLAAENETAEQMEIEFMLKTERASVKRVLASGAVGLGTGALIGTIGAVKKGRLSIGAAGIGLLLGTGTAGLTNSMIGRKSALILEKSREALDDLVEKTSQKVLNPVFPTSESLETWLEATHQGFETIRGEVDKLVASYETEIGDDSFFTFGNREASKSEIRWVGVASNLGILAFEAQLLEKVRKNLELSCLGEIEQ